MFCDGFFIFVISLTCSCFYIFKLTLYIVYYYIFRCKCSLLFKFDTICDDNNLSQDKSNYKYMPAHLN